MCVITLPMTGTKIVRIKMGTWSKVRCPTKPLSQVAPVSPIAFPIPASIPSILLNHKLSKIDKQLTTDLHNFNKNGSWLISIPLSYVFEHGTNTATWINSYLLLHNTSD
jgi:hypothetical protein